MSTFITAIASESYVSFLCAMEGEGAFGCLLPRSDAEVFVERIKELVNANEHFPESDFECGSMYIETMEAGLSIMFQCTDMTTENRIQFGMETTVCRELLDKIESSTKTATQSYGPPGVNTKPWHFFVPETEENVNSEKMN